VVVESRMIALLEACVNSQVIKHPGGTCPYFVMRG